MAKLSGGDSARFEMPPLASVIDVVALERWTRTAAPGARLVYAAGRAPPRSTDAWRRAGELASARVVTLTTAKQGGETQWVAVKLPPPAEIRNALVEARTEGWSTDPIDLHVARTLLDAANAGGPCPTNRELSEQCGLGTGREGADRASWRVRKVVKAGVVIVIENGPGERRTAIDPATGKSTVRARL